MTFPVWIPVGPWRLHPHLAFELVAYVVAVGVYLRLRRRQGDHISTTHRWSLLTAASTGAVIGSRVLFWLEDPAATLAQLSNLRNLTGGQTSATPRRSIPREGRRQRGSADRPRWRMI